MDIGFLINECIKLNYASQEVIEAKITNLQKINNILKLQGCVLIQKNEKYILLKTTKPLSIFNPDIELQKIIDSKEDILLKLKKIKKIISNFEIEPQTKDKLKAFLDKLKNVVNDKLKKEILEIEKNIKVKSSAIV